jgi:hypothetical protein
MYKQAPTFKERIKSYWRPTDDSDGEKVKEQINKMKSNKSQKSIYHDDDLPVLLPKGALGAKELKREHTPPSPPPRR